MCEGFFLTDIKLICIKCSDVNCVLFVPPPSGELCQTLRTRCSSWGPEVSGEFQEVAASGHDPGDWGRSGVPHRPEAPVRREGRRRSAPTASFTTLSPHTMEVQIKVPFVSSELLMMFTLFFSFFSFVPRASPLWTENPHMLLNSRRRQKRKSY